MKNGNPKKKKNIRKPNSKQTNAKYYFPSYLEQWIFKRKREWVTY